MLYAEERASHATQQPIQVLRPGASISEKPLRGTFTMSYLPICVLRLVW